MSNLIIKTQTYVALTPCAGRCSTVFGDSVCRGCRRFNHEVIQWNKYSIAEKAAVWKRLDAQLDQILIPMLPQHQLQQVMHFLEHKRVKLMPDASLGRKLYHALKLCEKNIGFADESGLGLNKQQVKAVWKTFEARVLQLAQASYEVAWLRANFIQQNIQGLENDTE
ncbi:DUF1289 domain-containing protein [Acinetobacter qingfengensis]|uniref:Uncharacterized protein n=1 Tax=Acinetobacter qingfengensis TaxID=1262585 RepID=A0A1E7RG02_9GAMM|nr:DUF1289 domain-containing protein [Acinetobacter qingfengensis]KAA8732804.1 DUF1289 domain-containing protein [Acinetobacter qingfengensis]OEY98085.1 hypothetical protein BJI46_00750 [Acinetobacter qingfengensis]